MIHQISNTDPEVMYALEDKQMEKLQQTIVNAERQYQSDEQ